MIADETVLKRWGATSTEGCLQFKGWAFRSGKTVILNENNLVSLAKKLSSSVHGPDYAERDDDRIEVDGALLHLPCMVFGNNFLTMQSPETTDNKFKFSFIASDALKLWTMEHAAAAANGSTLHLLKVPFAWDKRGAKKSAGAPAVKSSSEEGEFTAPAHHTQWDWTFSTHDYCCTVAKTVVGRRVNTRSAIVAAKKLSKAPASASTAAASTVVEAPKTVFGFLSSIGAISGSNKGRGDTYAVDGRADSSCGKEDESKEGKETEGKEDCSDGRGDVEGEEEAEVCSWEACEASGIDMAMLRVQDDILFYDDVILYQDDLEDCGEVTLRVKTRVMPRCWFVLVRMYLRIDGGTIRVRDTRLFHNFAGDGYVYMDVTWHEGVMDTIEANLAAAAGPGARGSGMMVGQIGAGGFTAGPRLNLAAIRDDPSSILAAVPLVNDSEGITKHHRLKL